MHFGLEHNIKENCKGRKRERFPEPCQGSVMPQQPLYGQSRFPYHRDKTGTSSELFLTCAGHIIYYSGTAFISFLRYLYQDCLRSLPGTEHLPSGSVHGFWQEIVIVVGKQATAAGPVSAPSSQILVRELSPMAHQGHDT